MLQVMCLELGTQTWKWNTVPPYISTIWISAGPTTGIPNGHFTEMAHESIDTP